MDTAAETFEASRGRLEALAYRMTGRVSVAEDLVQEAYLRWRRTGAENAQTPKAYLRAVVTRLALDHLKSARARKETYPGPWLPEPRAREAASPEERLGQADAVSTALLAVLETLSPAERAVFVLREAFDVPYDEVAEILGKTPAHCRKIAQRARDAVEAEEPRRQASEAELARLVDAFLAATRAGDLEALGRLLAEDATLYSDGGEEVSPWFFYAPFHAPHTPMAEGNPKWWQMTRHFARGDRHLYAATLAHLDAAVGRIVDALEATGQREETLIVFFSDNGAVIGDYDGGSYPPPDPKLKAGYASNAPLRAGKKHVYEGGIRVPAFVNWGGTLSSDVVDAPTHVADWMPTFASLSGYDPQGASEWNDPEWDGTDIGPLLRGERTGYAQPRRLYWVWGRGRKREAVREGAWKLIREDGSDWELYNVAEDPREQNDLSASRPQKVKALLDVYQQERAKDWKEGKIESGNPTNR